MKLPTVFIFVLWIATIIYPMPVESRNRQLNFPGYFFFADRRLENHVIQTEHVKDLEQCEFLCYQHDNCVSVNIKKVPDSETGQHSCELNNSTHMEHDEDMVDDNAFFYRGAKNARGKNPPCGNKATCQSGFTDKGYRCVCAPGFKGEHCKKKTWKKINKTPVCFKARDNKHGTFEIKESGLINKFKLVHKSGSLTCNKDFPEFSSYWGCDHPNFGDKRLLTIITYPNKTALLLADYSLNEDTSCDYFSYQIAGTDVNSTNLVFNKPSTPLSVSVGQTFHIWYAQDLTDCTEDNNAGETCADVYAWYA